MTTVAAYSDLRRMRKPILTTRDASLRLSVSLPAATRLLTRLQEAGLAKRIFRGLWTIDLRVDPLAVPEHPVHGVDRAARRVQRRVEGGLDGDGVHVDHPPTRAAQLLDPVDVRGGVDTQELLACGGRRLDELHPQPPLLLEGRLDRTHALRALRMGAGVVRERGGVSEVERDRCTVAAL